MTINKEIDEDYDYMYRLLVYMEKDLKTDNSNYLYDNTVDNMIE